MRVRALGFVSFAKSVSNSVKAIIQGRVYSYMSISLRAMSTASYAKWSKKNLIQRIIELEGGHQVPVENSGNAVPTDVGETPSVINKTSNEARFHSTKKCKFDFSRFETRFIALRFAYMGWNYNGLNYQFEPTPLPTVEAEILKAMAKSKLISAEDPNCCSFSRCGRTDKGVSALNQVISLNIRSNLSKDQQDDPKYDSKEVRYIAILNSLLPPDIRITAVCLRPPANFDARFSCSYRHYKYLFKKTGLNIELMRDAAERFKGTHDFRNFCKIDGSKQITNHMREVYHAEIETHDSEFYVFDLKGSAFLWHQVRCMVAVLFLVGQKLENPTIVDELMDIDRYPSKPAYEMANDIPLVLYDCVFPEMEWLSTEDIEAKIPRISKEHRRFNAELTDYQLKAQVARMVEDVFIPKNLEGQATGGSVNTGDGMGRNFKNYVPLSKRDRNDSVAVVNARYVEKQKKKLANTSQECE